MSNEHNAPVANTEIKKPAPDLTKVTPIVVTRNGIDYELTPFAGRRGAWDGVVYQAPQVKTEDGKQLEEDNSFQTGLKFIGKETVARILNIFCKRFAQDAHTDAIPDEGENKGIFQLDKFVRSIQEFSVAQLRISELRELYDEAVAQYMSFCTGEFVQVMTMGSPEDKVAIQAKMQQMTAQVNQYKQDLEERAAKKSKEAETETVRAE